MRNDGATEDEKRCGPEKRARPDPWESPFFARDRPIAAEPRILRPKKTNQTLFEIRTEGDDDDQIKNNELEEIILDAKDQKSDLLRE